MRNLVCSLVLAAVFVCGARAQFDTATVLGTIIDPTGAVVVNCEVTLENVETGVRATSLTDSVGNYQFFNVRIGVYQVGAEQSGFKRAVSDPFSVTVSARQRVDLTLEVGDATETIEVTGAALLLEADTSDRGTVIGARQAVDLPLNGRSYADLTLLSPGTSQALRGALSGRNASYHVNGLRSSYNNFTLDGVDNNAYGTSNQGFSNQVVQLAPDAVGEFKVTTNNFSAEYGRAGGAVINATLKSGTNQYHFTAWEFLRNTQLNATGFFKPQTGEKPLLIQNQFGVAAGGPIVKNRAFFFGDYEGFRQRDSQLRFASVPTADQKGGLIGQTLVDPYTGTPYGGAGDSVPTSLQTPFSQLVLADLPNPNRQGSGSDGVGNNFESVPKGKLDDNRGDVKGDLYGGDKLTFFGRYSQRSANQFEPDEIPGPSGGDSNGNVRVKNWSVAVGTTYTVNPTSILEVRLGWTKTDAGKRPVNYDGPHMSEFYGIPNVPIEEEIGGGLNSQQVSGFNSWGRQTSNPQFQNPIVWNPRVNYSTIAGAHTLKLGYEHQRIDTEINDLAPVYGRSGYGGRFSGLGSGSNLINLADFFVGAQSNLQMSTFEILQYRQRMHFFYVQDDWKVSPNLTLNLGVRYEFATPQWEANNHLGNFDPATASLILAKDGSLEDRSTIQPDYNNWAPRIGLAYKVTPKTVIRSGYGVSYIHFNRMGGENILGFTGPFYFSVSRDQVAPALPGGGEPLCGAGQDFTTCFTRTQDGFPGNFVSAEQYSTLTSRVNYQPRDNRSGYVQSWHFTVQRQLARDWAIDLGYVGNRGAKQLILGDFNQARPNEPGENLPLQTRRPYQDYSFIQIAFSGGNTFYHALQAKLEKKWSAGFYFLNSFTWAKSIDNAPGHLETYNGDTSRINFRDLASQRGLSSYDTPVNNVTSLIWEVPFGRGRHWGSSWSGVAEFFLGGWRTTTIHTARTGYPVNVYYNPSSQFQVCSGCSPRPNYLGGDLVNDGRPIGNFFNEDAVGIPTDRTQPFGTLGRNVARTHDFWQWDLGIHKDFPLPREGSRVEFRTELFNLFNKTNFLAPASRADASSFGTITGTFPARQIQFALKVYW